MEGGFEGLKCNESGSGLVKLYVLLGDLREGLDKGREAVDQSSVKVGKIQKRLYNSDDLR
jgi:hypothetical protein